MTSGGGRRSRAVMAAIVVIGTVVLGVGAGLWSGGVLVGIGVALTYTAVLVGGSLAARHVAESKVKGALAYPLSVEAFLDVSCLPGNWPELAPETQAVLASGAPIAVTVTASSGFLRVENRMRSRFAEYPFAAQAPLAAIKGVSAGKSRLMLGGSSLTFMLASGEELRVDLKVGQAMAAELATAFQAAAASSRVFATSGEGLAVVSPPPPARTPRRVASALVLICFPAFLAAMVGAHDGLFAAIAAGATIVLAKVLEILRPPSARDIIGKAMLVVALAFAVDAARTGQPLRLGGSTIALAIAAFLLHWRPTGEKHGLRPSDRA